MRRSVTHVKHHLHQRRERLTRVGPGAIRTPSARTMLATGDDFTPVLEWSDRQRSGRDALRLMMLMESFEHLGRKSGE